LSRTERFADRESGKDTNMKTLSHPRLPIGTLTIAAMLLLPTAFAASSFAAEADKPATGGSTTEALKTSPEKHGRLISLVVLLKEPRKLEEAALGDLVSKALGIARDPDIVDKGFVTAKPPFYKVEVKSGLYVINNIAVPYFENADQLVKEIAAPDLRTAVTENKAWISVDWAGKEEPADLRATYRDMGKIAAALARPDALAIYSPEAGDLSVFNESVATLMAGDDPFQIFDGNPDDSEAVSVSETDPMLLAAQEKARKAWPEFARAFQAKAGKDFAVSGRIAEGDNAEYMWISVTSIDGDKVHGKLDSAPVALTNLKMGQDLHIQLSDVDDWIYVGKDDVPVGGFTKEALTHARDSARN
jgi:uncharacterized protein YegJ (DUF2314 family)